MGTCWDHRRGREKVGAKLGSGTQGKGERIESGKTDKLRGRGEEKKLGPVDQFQRWDNSKSEKQ